MKRAIMLLLCLTLALPLAAGGEGLSLTEDYMLLNGVERENHPGQYYLTLNLPDESPIPLISISEAMEVQDGFLYFGANWCPHCRNFIEVLLLAAENTETAAPLYASSAEKIKTLWELDENGQLIKTREAGEGYEALLAWLSPLLSEYVLLDAQGQAHDTGELRIYMPCVILVEGGVPVSRWSLSDVAGYTPNEDAHAPWSLIQKGQVYESIRAYLLQTDIDSLYDTGYPVDCGCEEP